jgi:hypothetical protein
MRVTRMREGGLVKWLVDPISALSVNRRSETRGDIGDKKEAGKA